MSDGRVVIDSYLDPSGAEAGWAQLQGKMESGAQKVGNIGKTLTQTVTAPLVAAGTAAFKFSMDQETAFAKVSTLLTGSESEMEAYKRAIRTASNDMGVSFDEYSEAVYQSISANIDQAEAIGFTEKAVRLAKGGFTDTATAVDIMTTAINAYGLEAEDADHVTDVLINTQNQGKTTVDELAASMGKVIPVAEMNNVSLEQLSTGYAVLTRNGISTAEAGTYLRAMFDELGKSGSDVDDILRERTGKSFAELQAEGYNTADVLGILQEEADETGLTVTDFFGSTQAGTAAMTLLSGEGKEFNEILESMGEATGSTEAAFDKMNETAEQKLFNALNRVRNVLAELGDIFLPLVADAADWASQVIEELSTRFFTLDEDTQRTTVAIAAAAAAIGPLLMTVPLLAKAVGLLGTGFSMLFSPIGTVVRVVASLATGATT
ncbi:phage tail tape measure protein [Thalassobacillus sp. C254]|uniref:phage tail tape measure protein n=1 Tax=Thalassobacillus sp. C254 TaxID=1225341 RepID=UPI0006D15C1B|nr:phage tail tape measure protein [Thalassobacillus sp. C254]